VTSGGRARGPITTYALGHSDAAIVRFVARLWPQGLTVKDLTNPRRRMDDNWFNEVEGLLNSFLPIGQLTDEQIEQLADIYWDLARRPAAVRRDGVLRTFGPTAAAKAMMFFFGETCPAWDAQIRRRTNGFGARASYVRYLNWARSQAQHAAPPTPRAPLRTTSAGRTPRWRSSSTPPGTWPCRQPERPASTSSTGGPFAIWSSGVTLSR